MCLEMMASLPATPTGENCPAHEDGVHRIMMPSAAWILDSGTVSACCVCNTEFFCLFKHRATVGLLALGFLTARSRVKPGHMTLMELLNFCVIYRNDIIEFRVTHRPPSYGP